MRRLYYLVDSLDESHRASDALHREGINDGHFHILSRDESGLYRHHLHSANPWQKRDILRCGERGALIGLAVGVVGALLTGRVFELSESMAFVAHLVALGLPTLFGAWVGGLAGLSMENYKVQRFHDDLEAGRYLLMVDVPRQHCEAVRGIMCHFAVEPAGEDSTLVLPFELN